MQLSSQSPPSGAVLSEKENLGVNPRLSLASLQPPDSDALKAKVTKSESCLLAAETEEQNSQRQTLAAEEPASAKVALLEKVLGDAEAATRLLESLPEFYFDGPDKTTNRLEGELADGVRREGLPAKKSNSKMSSDDPAVKIALCELTSLPTQGNFLLALLSRLSYLTACQERVQSAIRAGVARHRDALTSSTAVLGELKSALTSVRRGAASVGSQLAFYKNALLQPSMDVLQRQRGKQKFRALHRHLRRIQKVAATLLAVEECLILRNAPLAVALLLEGLASPESLRQPLFHRAVGMAKSGEEPKVHCVQRALAKMNGLLDNVRAELGAVLHSTPKSLPPPRCQCGWEEQNQSSFLNAEKRSRPRGAEGEWNVYVSAMKALSLMPSSPRVGAALARGLSVALDGAATQVVCAFIPANASEFVPSELGRETVRAEGGDGLLMNSALGDKAFAFYPHRTFNPSSLRRLASAVPYSEASVCLLTVLSALRELNAGAEELMDWHADRAAYLMQQSITLASKMQAGPLDLSSEKARLEMPAVSDSSTVAMRDEALLQNLPASASTHELAEKAARRLRSLPSPLRLALFLLTVRRQFFRQRRALWTHCQQVTAQVVEALNFFPPTSSSSSSSSSFSSVEAERSVFEKQLHGCLASTHALLLFSALGEVDFEAEFAHTETRLAALAREAVAAQRTKRETLTASSHSPSSAFSIAWTVASDDASEEALWRDQEEAALGAERVLAEPWTPRVSDPSDNNVPSTSSPTSDSHSNPNAGSSILLSALEKALLRSGDSLCAQQKELLLRASQTEKWSRVPVRRSFPLVVLRTPPSPATYESVARKARRQASSSSDQADQNGYRDWPDSEAEAKETVCETCKCPLRPKQWNPFAKWRDSQTGGGIVDERFFSLAKADPPDVRAIDEELNLIRLSQNQSEAPAALPVVTALSQLAAECIMRFWSMACSAPVSSVTLMCVDSMLQLVSTYIALAATVSLPRETLASLAGKLSDEGCSRREGRAKLLSAGDTNLLRRSLPHLCELLVREEDGLRRAEAATEAANRSATSKRESCRGGASGILAAVSKKGASEVHFEDSSTRLAARVPQLPKLSSPGSLWAVAEKVAAVESAAELALALDRQLVLQGLGGKGRAVPALAKESSSPSLSSSSSKTHDGTTKAVVLGRLSSAEKESLVWKSECLLCAVEELRAIVYRTAASDLCQSASFVNSITAGAALAQGERGESSSSGNLLPAVAMTAEHHRRELQDLYWRLRCADGGSIALSAQLSLWRAIRSQCVADAIEALSCAPLPVDFRDKGLCSGALVAFAEAVRGVIYEANFQLTRASQASSTTVTDAATPPPPTHSSSREIASDLPPPQPTKQRREPRRHGGGALDLEEPDFDAFLEACSLSASETLRWCLQWRKREGQALLPLRVLSNALLRLENAQLLNRGAAAEFEATHASLLRQAS